jgi:hypothetical protein
MSRRRGKSTTPALKITAAKNDPAKYGSLWWGTATDGAEKIEWFYQPRLYLHMRREERPCMWMNFDPADSARQIVLKAVRAAKAS